MHRANRGKIRPVLFSTEGGEDRMPDRIKLIQGLLVFKAAVWVVLAAGYFVTQDTVMSPTAQAIVGTLLLADAALYLCFGWAIGKRNRWITLLTLAFIAANALLTITDEFGLADLFVLVADAVIVLLILRDWRVFWKAADSAIPRLRSG